MNKNSNPDTRATLIARIRDAGDNESWTEFVAIYQPVVQRFLQKHGLQYADAAEVTQEVLSSVATSIQSWDGSKRQSTFRGWLFRITQNRAIDFLRKLKVQRSRDAGQASGLSNIAISKSSSTDAFQAEYERQLFHWAAAQLKPAFKPKNWQAFWLSAVEGRSIEEVAKKLKVDCGAVYVARSRIMARLSKLIQQRLNETSASTDSPGGKQ